MVSWVSLVTTALIGYVMWYVFKFIQQYRVWTRITNHPNVHPIAPTHWFFGHVLYFSDAQFFIKEIFKGIEPGSKMSYIWIFFFDAIFFFNHPDAAKVIMKSSEPKPKGRGEPYYFFVPWIGDGLLMSDGPKWERNRRLITPAFHFDVLKSYMPIFNSTLAECLDRMYKRSSDGTKSVKVDQMLQQATLDAMLRCAFSLKTTVQVDGEEDKFVAAIQQLEALSFYKLTRPWTNYEYIFKLHPKGREYYRCLEIVHSYSINVVQRRRKELADNESNSTLKKKPDFLDILLTARTDTGEGLTDKELMDEVNTFLFAGHDTTSSALLFEVYCLATNPEEQEKVYQEVKGIMGDKHEVEWEMLSKLNIMTLFIKESLRLYTPVTGINRKITKDIEVDGVVFPAGLNIGVMLSSLHRHPDVWGNDVKEFRPTRFLEHREDKDPYSFAPFAAGPRNCIGQVFALNEQKVFLSKLLMRFKLTLDETHEVIPQAEITLGTKNGIKVYLTPRT